MLLLERPTRIAGPTFRWKQRRCAIEARCRIEMRRPKGNVAYDGEIERMTAPLEYRYHRDALQLVSPSPAERAAGILSE